MVYWYHDGLTGSFWLCWGITGAEGRGEAFGLGSGGMKGVTFCDMMDFYFDWVTGVDSSQRARYEG